VPGENLPAATSTAIGDDDDGPYEVEVVVDFGVASAVEYPALTASTVAAHRSRSTDRNNSTAPAETIAAPPVSQPKASTGANRAQAVEAEPSGSDRMSDVSENWAEDRYAPETAEEKEAKAATGDLEEAQSEVDVSEDSPGGQPSERRGSARSSFIGDLKSSLQSSKQSIRSSLQYLGTQIQTAKEMYTRHIAQKSPNTLEPRETVPRMGWHDIQASVTGLVARDVASHFVQVITSCGTLLLAISVFLSVVIMVIAMESPPHLQFTLQRAHYA
jgi:hypothetical protein